MTVDLKQTITDIIREHRFWSLRGECTCGEYDSSDPDKPDMAAHVADAVVAALEADIMSLIRTIDQLMREAHR